MELLLGLWKLWPHHYEFLHKFQSLYAPQIPFDTTFLSFTELLYNFSQTSTGTMSTEDMQQVSYIHVPYIQEITVGGWYCGGT